MKNFFLATDAHSKWGETLEMYTLWPLPLQIVSDNSHEIISREFSTFLKMNGVKHTRCAPYNLASRLNVLLGHSRNLSTWWSLLLTRKLAALLLINLPLNDWCYTLWTISWIKGVNQIESILMDTFFITNPNRKISMTCTWKFQGSKHWAESNSASRPYLDSWKDYSEARTSDLFSWYQKHNYPKYHADQLKEWHGKKTLTPYCVTQPFPDQTTDDMVWLPPSQ